MVEDSSSCATFQNQMKIIFRTDSSMDIGTGHVMRCLTLAEALHNKGAKVSFICRDLRGNLNDFVERKGFTLYRLLNSAKQFRHDEQNIAHAQRLGVDWQTDAEQTKSILAENGYVDWLIIDNYSLGKNWETRMRPYVKGLMVIDDLADRFHDCDLLLDQNFYENFETRYDELVPYNCRKLLGPKYALLRPEFAETRKNLKQRNCKVNRILVSFGGNDPTDETTKSLKAIMSLNRPDIAVDVVVGSSNPHKEKIERICSAMTNASFYCQINNMAQLMADADLSIGAGGATTWERCCLGLPSIVMTLAENQRELANHLEKEGIVMHLGWHKEVSEKDMWYAVENLLTDSDKRKKMSLKGKEMVDGMGAKKVVEKIMKVNLNETAS